MFFGGMQIRIKIFYCDAKSDPLLTWEAEQKAKWFQEQKNRKKTFIDLYGLIDKLIIIIVSNTKKMNKTCMN